jgi:hypothetical protein
MRTNNAQKRKTDKMEGWNNEMNKKDDARNPDGHHGCRNAADVKGICSPNGNYEH